jgi:hypothetical protein
MSKNWMRRSPQENFSLWRRRVLEEPINKIQTEAAQPASDSVDALPQLPEAKANLLPFWYVLAFSLMIRLWFNFGTAHQNAYNSCDAAEYIRYAQALSLIISGQVSGPIFEGLKEFVITGPSLPVFLLLATALTGQPFDPANSNIALTAQSVISALTAGLIYLITRRLYEKKTALYAGIFAAIYPAFIVNSGRLYSETLATFVESLTVLLIVRGMFLSKKLVLNNIALGAALIVLELTRSAMVLWTIACLPIVFLQGLMGGESNKKDWRRALISLSLVLVGTAVVLAPWFAFEKAAYNKITLAVDRVGHYNLFVGTNTATQGFLSYPYPDGRGIEEKSFVTLLNLAFLQSPSRFIKLALDKPSRLLKSPWNDFRCPIGPFDYKLQVALHQLILFLAIIGMLVACAVSPEQNLEGQNLDKRKILGRLTLLGAFALNLPYLAFITVPRYNLTAMPFLIIFAAAGLSTINYLLKSQPLAKAPKALVIISLCLFIFLRDDLRYVFSFGQEPIANIVLVQGQDLVTKGMISTAFGLIFFGSIYFCLPFLVGYKKLAFALTVVAGLVALPLLAVPQRANGRFGESILTLERKGEWITGTLPVPDERRQNQDWYLLIDSEDPTLISAQLDLTINGQKITGPLIPGISALDDWHYLKQKPNGQAYLECAYIYDCMTQPSAMTNLDLRQWFYLPLSPSIVSEARRRGCLNVSLKHKINAATKLFAAALGKDSATIPCRALYSWEKAFYGVENDSGLTDSRYDEKVPLRKAKWTMNFDKTSEELDHFDPNLRLLSLNTSPSGDSTTSKEIAASGTKDVFLPLTETLLKEGPFTLVRATLSYAPDYKPEHQYNIKIKEALPQLSLEWLDNKGKQISLCLPWLKKTHATLDIAIPCDLTKIQGSHLTLKAHYIDPDCQIKLGARAIASHPIFGGGSLH